MAASPTVPAVIAVQKTPEAISKPATTKAAGTGPEVSSKSPAGTSASPSGAAPYNYSNGTHPEHYKPSNHVNGESSSGFLTKSKPTAMASGYSY